MIHGASQPTVTPQGDQFVYYQAIRMLLLATCFMNIRSSSASILLKELRSLASRRGIYAFDLGFPAKEEPYQNGKNGNPCYSADNTSRYSSRVRMAGGVVATGGIGSGRRRVR